VTGAIMDGELTSLALCWRLDRRDGAGLALTSHDEALIVDGDSYSPAPGMMPAAVTRSLGLDGDSGEVSGALSSDGLQEEDLSAGRWDDASIALAAVDWTDAALPAVNLIRGEIGNISSRDGAFSCDLRGAAARLDDPVCPSTSAECRAHFGDKTCRVDLAGRTLAATIVSTNGNVLKLDRDLDERFLFGRLRYLGGANCGLATVILAVGGAEVQVRDLPRLTIGTGCRVEIREGCDKRFDTCVSRFANAVNFRGEPHLPGNDLLTRYPGA
jgi:uncharacterized phage protein (TIGR02218 family)